MENHEYDKQQRAKKKIEEIKGFYIHLSVYIIVNLFITIKNVIGSFQDGKPFWDAFWDLGNYVVWILWGTGLMFHAINALDYNLFFGKGWEERQIRKYMEEDKKESEKYR
ncbi:MAG TPA: 2TM domain-containing protein [Arenibacter sp.]|nr:2TM domain-containing protein [Arenibacter sp.]